MLLPKTFNDLGVFLCLEHFIEDRLEVHRIRERPKGLVLVAEDDVFEHGFGDAQQLRDLLFYLCAVVVDLEHFTLLIFGF